MADFITLIASKYLRHLGSIERLKQSFGTKLEEKEKEKLKSNDIGGLVSYILHLKYENLKATKEGNFERLEEVANIWEEFEENTVFQAIDKKTSIKESEDEYIMGIDSVLLRKAYDNYVDSTMDSEYDNSQFENSLIVSLVIGLEILIAEIIKDYVKRIDVTEQVIKNKKIDFNTLSEIGSVEEAKSYLIDKHIEGLLRASFSEWLNEIEKTIKIKINSNQLLKCDIKLVNETFQRRHLIIHNDGIINDLYVNGIDESLRENVQKGEEVDSSEEYLSQRLSTFKTFGLVLLYQYGVKRYRNDMEGLFSQYNNILISYLKNDFVASRYIFKCFSEEERLGIESQGISMINYFLTYKLNEDDSIINEIKDFNANQYGEEFVLAKKILLEEPDAEDATIEFLKKTDNDDFVHTLTWPLLKTLNKTGKFKGFVDERMESIFREEMAGDLVEAE